MDQTIGLILLCMAILGCDINGQNVATQEIYEGPSIEMDNIDMQISDSTILKVRLLAKKQLIFDDDNREFPDGILLEFYNDFGLLTSKLIAQKGYYYAKEDYYQAEGNVIMINLFNRDELSTELLNWVPKEEKIYTDNFVTIKTEGEVHTGEGLEASQDFDEYTILKPSGTITLDENN